MLVTLKVHLKGLLGTFCLLFLSFFLSEILGWLWRCTEWYYSLKVRAIGDNKGVRSHLLTIRDVSDEKLRKLQVYSLMQILPSWSSWLSAGKELQPHSWVRPPFPSLTHISLSILPSRYTLRAIWSPLLTEIFCGYSKHSKEMLEMASGLLTLILLEMFSWHNCGLPIAHSANRGRCGEWISSTNLDEEAISVSNAPDTTCHLSWVRHCDDEDNVMGWEPKLPRTVIDPLNGCLLPLYLG